MFKIICIILFLIIETPFVIKFIKAKNEYDIIRQTAIIILMVISALIVFIIYKLGLFVVR